jgi:hypothetical protein
VAHSYLDYEGHSIQMDDADIALVVYALLAQAESDRSSVLPESILSLLAYWEKVIDVSGPGCIDLRLDSHLNAADDRDAFLRLTKDAEQRLLAKGEIVDLHESALDIHFQSIWFTNSMPASHVRKAFGRFSSLFERRASMG